MRKKLGVIGGMGSEATSYYFEEVLSHTAAKKDQDHIDMMILNHATIPDRTEAILAKDTAEIIGKLIQDAQLLERIGAENIAIPCNTSHYFYDEIQNSVSIPVIDMPRETVLEATKKFTNVKKIGIMATTGTIQTRLYHRECEKLGVEAIIPSEKRQKDVMSLIYDDIKSGLPGDASKFQRAYDELSDNGCDVVILACTELSVFKKSNKIPTNCIDAMDVLVKESIQRSNAVYE